MTCEIAIAGYLVLWLLLRLLALRTSKAAQIKKRSPWFTRIILVFCFAYTVWYVSAHIGSATDNSNEGLVRIGIGITIVVFALIVEAFSLFSLSPFYSLEMEVKKDHTVVKTGLYRFVRHPIYMCNIIGFCGLSILMNTWVAWLALPAQIYGFILMARHEERFLIGNLGNEYKNYSIDVRWMFIPKV